MRTRLVLLVPLALLLIAPAGALAAAGGGSSGFGGGGGGGGFSGGGGGSYGGGSGSGEGGFVGFLIVIGIVLAIFAVGLVANALDERRIRKRDRRVSTASAEAAEDDEYLAAEAVKRDAHELFREIQAAWDARERSVLARLVGPDLMQEWGKRLDDFDAKGWHNVVKVLSGPEVSYVGLVNREDDRDDRVVVRVEAKIKDYVEMKGGGRMNADGQKTDTRVLEEYWTLGRTAAGGWRLLSIEQDEEGKHHLEADIVATPWADTERLRDQSLVEGAVADKVAEGFTVAEVADLDLDGDARAAALDLSLADARFGPDVLEAAARRAVAGWAEAVDGEDRDLEAVAEPAAVQELLHPGDPSGRTRLVVRGPRIQKLRIAALDAAAQPPTMTVEVDVAGTRYLQDRDTAAIVAGSDSSPTTFTERWTMVLSGPDEQPWRIAGVAGAGVR
jgi:predicted lipid-binding transport protein (Tim44 family)